MTTRLHGCLTWSHRPRMPQQRTNAVQVYVSDEELSQLKALADVGDESMSQVVRRSIRVFYRERFGERARRAKNEALKRKRPRAGGIAVTPVGKRSTT